MAEPNPGPSSQPTNEPPRPPDLPPQTVVHHEPQPTEIHHPDGRIEHPSVRRETTDVRFLQVITVIVAIVVIGAIVFYVAWIVFNGITPERNEHSNFSYQQAPNVLPVEPRLEPLDRLRQEKSSNVYDRQRAAERKLMSYGATDEQGYVHIPIQQAIKLIVPKLPIRAQAPNGANEHNDGLLDGGEPNSGRVFRKAVP